VGTAGVNDCHWVCASVAVIEVGQSRWDAAGVTELRVAVKILFGLLGFCFWAH